MLTKQVLDENNFNKYKKCYKLCDNKSKVSATQERNSNYHWDYANYSQVLSVMSLPSPNGSTSSIISSEDSSTASTLSSRQSSQHQYALSSQPSTSSSSSFQSGSASVSSKLLKLCRVCGDRAKSYHFGGISCDSCKAFFRRSVQNDAYRNFNCPYLRKCEITINSRKSCQYCRFNKCLSIGMEKSWVMTEEERMQMLKNRMEKRKQEEESIVKTQFKYNQIQEIGLKYEPDLCQINNYLTDEEVKLIENVLNLYIKCSKEISFKIRSDKSQPSRTDILNLFFTAIQQFALFFDSGFESFDCISIEDKQILLRNGVLELCFLRGAFIYDMRGKYWQYEDKPSSVIYSHHLQIMVTHSLLEKHMHFIKTLKRLHLDEATNILLLLIVLLSPDREGLIDSQLVQKEQEKYLLLLKSYMNWRYGTDMSSILYPKLLLKLTDLRELAEAHTDYQLLLGKEELEQIQQRLSTLHIGITGGFAKTDSFISCDVKEASTATHSPWSIKKCFTNKSLITTNLYADEELSTSSEGSEKLSSD